jgi:hypothetical protein
MKEAIVLIDSQINKKTMAALHKLAFRQGKKGSESVGAGSG